MHVDLWAFARYSVALTVIAAAAWCSTPGDVGSLVFIATFPVALWIWMALAVVAVWRSVRWVKNKTTRALWGANKEGDYDE